MTETVLVKLFEHNNWANSQLIQACSALTAEQLDAEPLSATKGSIRRTLVHLVASQQAYLSFLTLPVEVRSAASPPIPSFAELQNAARITGEGLLALARDEPKNLTTQLRATDGYLVERWVVMVQAINHATEHREQVKSMLSALGVTPPALDGWAYGRITQAILPPAS